MATLEAWVLMWSYWICKASKKCSSVAANPVDYPLFLIPNQNYHQKLVRQLKIKLKWLLFDNFYVTKPFSRALLVN